MYRSLLARYTHLTGRIHEVDGGSWGDGNCLQVILKAPHRQRKEWSGREVLADGLTANRLIEPHDLD
jgi:hypothetical protein